MRGEKTTGLRTRRLLMLLVAAAAMHFSEVGAAPQTLRNLVDIGGGRRLNMVCAGSGPLTIVFLQGAGSNLTAWRKVWPSASQITRACLYDRAGFGYSDAPRGPMDAISATDDLRALIRKAGIQGRVVLVGHSLGGLYATVYADRFFADVAGLVLIDPSFRGQFDYAPSAGDKIAVYREFETLKTDLRRCAGLARGGKLTRGNSRDCFKIAPDRTPAETQYLTLQYESPAYYESYLSEYLSFFPGRHWTTTDDAEERSFARAFDDMPVEVLTAGIAPANPHKSAAGNMHFAENWKRGHDRLAARSSRGRSLVVPDSRHEIQIDQPNAVISSIARVVSQYTRTHRQW